MAVKRQLSAIRTMTETSISVTKTDNGMLEVHSDVHFPFRSSTRFTPNEARDLIEQLNEQLD